MFFRRSVASGFSRRPWFLTSLLLQLKGFEKLLRDYPQYRGNVVLIQVTSPALSDSPKLERQVSEAVARINGEFGSLDFIPVHHYHQSIGKDEFYALLSAADLALITPLRDGMNTTSMEFVICQEKTKKSPLVLSEFMGIAGTMKDALQINPWDLGGLAAAIDRGLTMPDEEKARRQEALHNVVTTHTSATWALALVKMLLGAINTENKAHSTPELDRALFKTKYDSAQKRLLLFDYDVRGHLISCEPWLTQSVGHAHADCQGPKCRSSDCSNA